MSAVPDRVLELIRKCLTLAGDKAATPAEAASAAARAQELLDRHNLDLAQIEAHGARARFEEAVFDDVPGALWRQWLINGVAKTSHCRAIILSTGKIAVVGERHNVEVVRYLYVFLSREIDRLTDAAWSDEHAAGAARWRLRAFKNSFRKGAVSAIVERLKERERARTATPQAQGLVRVEGAALDRYFAEHHPKVRTGPRSTTIAPAAFGAGLATGRRVALNDAVARGQGAGRLALS